MATLHFLANPARFRRFSQRVLPVLSIVTALALAPASISRWSSRRPTTSRARPSASCSVHVPSAWLAMAGYGLLAALGAALLVWRHPAGRA
jgi:heme exporter protein C